MNQYVTGTIIKELRERNKMTQLQLADKLGVTDKIFFYPTISLTKGKWKRLSGYYAAGANCRRFFHICHRTDLWQYRE